MATEIGSLEYILRVKDESSSDLEKIAKEIQQIGQTMADTAVTAKKGFAGIEAAITNTEKTIKTSNDQTVQALGMLGSVMTEVRDAVNRTNQTLADNEKAKRAVEETTEAIEKQAQATSTAKQEAGLLGDAMKAAAGYFAVDKVLDFSRSVVETRKNMQTLRVTFNTLLGDEKKAEGMFNELKDFATSTPLQMEDLAKAAQTMLSFGVDDNKILPFLKNIGDISMGDAQKMQSLTLAFSQMSSTGKLMGQDLNQMINAGFNPLEEISRKTGVSMAVLKDQMSAGRISVEMVQDAFKSATSEGGKFYGMLQSQSESMAGAISNFEGAMTDFKNELGSAIEGPLVSAYNLGTKLLKNYEALATALLSLVAAVGTYKAAMVVANNINTVQKVLTAVSSYKKLKEAIDAVAASQKMLAIKSLINPWALLAAGIVAAAVALARYNSEKERQRRLEENLNNELAKKKGYASSEAETKVKDEVKINVDVVFDKTNEKTALEQAAAYEKLVGRYEELRKKYKTVSDMQKADKSDVMRIISQKDETETIKAEQKRLEELQGTIKEAQEELNKLEDEGYDNPRYYGLIKKLRDAKTEENEIKERVKERAKAEAQLAESEKKARKESEEALKIERLRETAADEEAEVKQRRAALEDLKKITGDKEKELEKQVNAAEKAAKAKQKAEEAEQKARQKEKNRATVSAFEQQMQNEIEAADKMIDKLKALDKARESAKQTGGAVGAEEIKAVNKAEATLLRDAIKSNKQSRDEERRYNKERMTENERYEAERKALLVERAEVETKMAGESKERQLRIYDEMLDEMERRHLNAVKQTYDQSVEQFGDYKQRLAQVDREYQDQIDAARSASDKETERNLTVEREQKKVEVLNDYLSKLPAVGAAWTHMQELSTEALTLIRENLQQLGIELSKDLSKQQVEALGEKLREIGEELNSRSTLSFSKQLESIRQAKKELTESNRKLKSLQADGLVNTEEWTEALENNVKAQKKLEKTQEELRKKVQNFSGTISALGNTISNATSEMNESARVGGQLIDAMFNLVSTVCDGMVQTSRTAAESIRDVETSSVILAIIDAIIAAVKAVVNALPDTSTAWETIADTFENYLGVLNEVIDKEYELLSTMSGEEARESYEYIESQLNLQMNLYRYAGLTLLNYQKQHKNFLSDLFSVDYKSEAAKWFVNFRDNSEANVESLNNSEAGSYFVKKYQMDSRSFYGKVLDVEDAKDEYVKFMKELITLDAETLSELKRNSTMFWAGLNSDLQNYLNGVIESYEKMKEATYEYYETITTVSFDSVRDDFLEMISDMDTSAEDFANRFTEYMRSAMIRSAVFNSSNGIGKELEKWYESFGQAMESGGTLDKDEIEYLNKKRDQLFEKAREMVEGINEYFDIGASQSALSGAYATASQESIDLLAGQTNAVRQNQLEAINIMREQLTALLNINSSATISNELLQSIDTRLANQNTGLRAYGITEIPE